MLQINISQTYNPYSITEKDGRYFLFFKDGQGVPHYYEIDRPLFDLFDSFELDDLSYLNVVDRHIEQSELTETSLNMRAFDKPASFEDAIINSMQTELLHKAIAELPETQRRRLCLYYFAGLAYERIAELEGCHFTSVREAVLRAEKNIKNFLDTTPKNQV